MIEELTFTEALEAIKHINYDFFKTLKDIRLNDEHKISLKNQPNF
jgi:hypothetical protein